MLGVTEVSAFYRKRFFRYMNKNTTVVKMQFSIMTGTILNALYFASVCTSPYLNPLTLPALDV